MSGIRNRLIQAMYAGDVVGLFSVAEDLMEFIQDTGSVTEVASAEELVRKAIPEYSEELLT